jgi:hypothetical protein
MATFVSRSVTLYPAQLHGLLVGRSGAVGRVMAGFAGLATVNARRVANERIVSRSGAYVSGIRSSTRSSARGVVVETTASAPHSRVLEKGSRPHVITPTGGKVLKFDGPGGGDTYARYAEHPGTQPYNILRDGIKRAGRQLTGIAGV